MLERNTTNVKDGTIPPGKIFEKERNETPPKKLQLIFLFLFA